MKAKPIDKSRVQTHGIQSTVKFGIKSSGLAHIFNVLRNQLYSDKILAVIREYSCNAYDAHVEAGKAELPIKITLPNRMNPVFKVRDYGLGLDDTDIQEVYAFYGESTKRNTNDQIGQLGLGSKSAFAYGDNFVINSYLSGKKHSYNAFIDPSQIGQISKLSMEDTTEKDGVEIVIPVHEGDFDEFSRKAINLFKYFKPKPIVHGLQSNHEWKAIIENEDKDSLFKGDGWTWNDSSNDRYSRGDAVAIMGNIGYPIDEYSLNLKEDEHELRQLLTDNLLLHIPIGDLEISASREKLQYTEFSRKNLIKMLKKVQKEISEKISESFSDCTTLYDARCLYGATFRTDSPLYALRSVLKKFLVFKGEVIDGSVFSTYNVKGVDLRHFKKTYRSEKYRPEEANSIDCNADTVVIENDIGHRRGLMGRMLPLILTKGKKPFLIEFLAYQNARIDGKNNVSKTAKEVRAAWFKDQKFDGKLIKLSELPQHKLAEFSGYGAKGSSSGNGYEKDAKHSAKCFEFDWNSKGGRWERKKSIWWSIADLDVENEKGVYVILDQFNVEHGATWERPDRIKTLKEQFDEMKMDFPKHIYAFKVKEREKIEGKKGWVNLFDWVKETLKAAIKSDGLNQAWIDTQAIDKLHQDGKYYRYNSSNTSDMVCTKEMMNRFNTTSVGLANPNGTLGIFLGMYNDMQYDKAMHTKINSIKSVSHDFNLEFDCPRGVKAKHDLKAELKKVYKKYSMLYMIDGSTWDYNWTVEHQKMLSNYINVIDVCEQEDDSTSGL